MNEMETRRYKITATREQLDILETLFKTMESMGNAGSSRAMKLFVDGDGAFHPEFEKFEKGEYVKLTSLVANTNEDTIKHGYGYIQKNCEEFNGDGYYIYYDFG